MNKEKEMKNVVFIDRFSEGLDDLTQKQQQCMTTVLKQLSQMKRFSVFEATANQHIARMMDRHIGATTKWRSIAVWPNTIKVGNEVGKNESDDTHDSREAAQAVCDLLRKHGFGGDGKVFPISTRVEPA